MPKRVPQPKKKTRASHVMFHSANRQDGSKGIAAHTPEGTLDIHNKEELQAQLEHYAGTIIRGPHSVVADSIFARRKYMELIRPALRYYCTKFDVTVPGWLADDSYYTDHMPQPEREQLFGSKPLRIGSFKELKKPKGQGR